MKDIFQELYNKVLSLFNSGKEEIDSTKNIAINRLKTVLMQDRVGFSERAIQMLKEELIGAVSKYMEIDTENFELQIDAIETGGTVLHLSIPVIKAKTDKEIDNALRVQELKTQRKAQEIVKELENLIKERTQALIDGKIDPSLIEEAAKKASEEEKEEEFEETETEASEENEIEEAVETETEDDNEAEDETKEEAENTVKAETKEEKEDEPNPFEEAPEGDKKDSEDLEKKEKETQNS